jgi:carboxylate-amine ligase
MPGGAAWSNPIGLFGAYGVELEYMIVDRETLDVLPIADRLFEAAGGDASSGDLEPDGPGGVVSWSNELVLHVVELKTQRPVAGLTGLADAFQGHVRRIDRLLEPMGAMLLPTGMHPWMDPYREARLWPHEYTEVYRAYDRIFDCRGHGWSNLQSAHLNLPFGDDAEFGRLHAAVRAVLPLVPALSASTPVEGGGRSDVLDARLKHYVTNAVRVPRMTGLVVPEAVFDRAGYESEILGRLYEDLRPLDPEGVLRHEFANARGAIARFDRGAIEIRLVDLQECPAADVAVLGLIAEVVRGLVEGRWCDSDRLRLLETESLHEVLMAAIRQGEGVVIEDAALLSALGFGDARLTGGEVWRGLLERVAGGMGGDAGVAERVVDGGTLASRIVRAGSGSDWRGVYRQLGEGLVAGRLFEA